jgi:hypothetical protein
MQSNHGSAIVPVSHPALERNHGTGTGTHVVKQVTW